MQFQSKDAPSLKFHYKAFKSKVTHALKMKALPYQLQTMNKKGDHRPRNSAQYERVVALLIMHKAKWTRDKFRCYRPFCLVQNIHVMKKHPETHAQLCMAKGRATLAVPGHAPPKKVCKLRYWNGNSDHFSTTKKHKSLLQLSLAVSLLSG